MLVSWAWSHQPLHILTQFSVFLSMGDWIYNWVVGLRNNWKDGFVNSLVAKEGNVIVCTVSQLYLAFLNNWLINLAKQGQHHSCRWVSNSWLREWGVARPCGFSTPSSRPHPKPTLLGLSWEQAGIWVSVSTFIHGNTFAIVYQDEVRIHSCLKFAYQHDV